MSRGWPRCRLRRPVQSSVESTESHWDSIIARFAAVIGTKFICRRIISLSQNIEIIKMHNFNTLDDLPSFGFYLTLLLLLL